MSSRIGLQAEPQRRPNSAVTIEIGLFDKISLHIMTRALKITKQDEKFIELLQYMTKVRSKVGSWPGFEKRNKDDIAVPRTQRPWAYAPCFFLF